MTTYIITKTRNGQRFGQTIASGFSTIEDARQELRAKFRIHLSERFHFVTFGDLIETTESGERIYEMRKSGYYQDANPSDWPEYEAENPIVGELEEWDEAEINSWDWDVWTYSIEEYEESEG